MVYRMKVAGLERDLPICPVNENLYIAGFVIFGDQELTVACARELLNKAPEYDYIISSYTYEGTSTNTFGSMRPDSDYTIVAFGYKAGTLTTSQIWRKEFHTLASGDPQDCTFSMNVVPGVDNAWIEIIPSDKVRRITEENLKAIVEGKRDFRF